MTELLNSYTFEAKKVVYYSVTVGAENKTGLSISKLKALLNPAKLTRGGI